MKAQVRQSCTDPEEPKVVGGEKSHGRFGGGAAIDGWVDLSKATRPYAGRTTNNMRPSRAKRGRGRCPGRMRRPGEAAVGTLIIASRTWLIALLQIKHLVGVPTAAVEVPAA